MKEDATANGVPEKDVKRFLEEGDIELVRLEIPDIDGLLRGKWVSTPKFIQSMRKGIGISNIILGYDISDVPYAPLSPNDDSGLLPTWKLGPYADIYMVPDLGTLRRLPWRARSAGVICDIVWQDGTLVANAPRTALKNAVQRLAGHGLKATCAVEYEFLLFAESPRSIREKRFRNLTPAFEGVHSYSHLRADELREFLAEAVEAMNTLGIPVEALHTEYAPGNVEITFNYADPLNAADTAARFKLAVKMAAKRNNMVATFMARSMEGERASGMSGHLHIGLRDEKGRNAMWGGQANRLSQTGIHFLAGILATLNEFCAFYGPTVNSYRRTVPHSFAPTNVTWGYENRSAAVRVLARDEPSTRLEHRRPGADANPYAVIAAALAGGCYGVDRAEEPPQALEGNAYDSTSAPECPTNLLEAIELLERGEVARDYLGKDFVDHFIGTRRWEWNQYSAAVLGRLSEWELERYFEMI